MLIDFRVEVNKDTGERYFVGRYDGKDCNGVPIVSTYTAPCYIQPYGPDVSMNTLYGNQVAMYDSMSVDFGFGLIENAHVSTTTVPVREMTLREIEKEMGCRIKLVSKSETS